ncbi:hypothetical protein GF340_03480 [Candidatus Peregrinibacteria bacterium]|nr:hypothetical protein [Candidatus Peregrinibacteria bacterium]
MDLNLTWDLFILAFFGIVIAYSFIIGRNKTLKIISASYIAILCSDALGNIFGQYLVSSEPFLKMMSLFGVETGDQAVAYFKVLVLIVFIVIIAVRGLYDFDAEDERSWGIRIGVLVALGIMSAGLMISAMMVFVTGSSFIFDGSTADVALQEVYGESRLVKLLVDYANFWFVIPGITIVFLSWFNKKTA